MVLTDDHLDLLMTAASGWHVLPSSATTAAFTALERDLAGSIPTRAGVALRAHNNAAMGWLAVRGRSRPADRQSVGDYAFRSVEHVDPMEVVKACHSAHQVCVDSPSWLASGSERLLSALGTAAVQRLPGYADAPWQWTRPLRRSGPPVGLSATWRPPIPGLQWVDVNELRGRWASASLIVVTAEAAEKVPVDLPRRQGVFLMVQDPDPDKVWGAVRSLDMPAAVLFWPTCTSWLAGQIKSPAPQFVFHRPASAGS